ATGTLFYYFKTKEELINQLYLYTKENMLNEIHGHYDDVKNLKENLKDLWFTFIYYTFDNPQKFQFILTFHTSPYITSLTKEQLETITEDMMGVYKKGMELQELKKISFELAMDFFWGNIVSTVNYFNKYPEKVTRKNLEMAFDLFWDGISK
ncbi:MAG: TetR/AcrR family transcriptional regulator, partial [Methanobacterium sp.]|nr:TetR/AcrR family transcriptional regulator [Methanobacterium sp.]